MLDILYEKKDQLAHYIAMKIKKYCILLCNVSEPYRYVDSL